MNEADIPNKAGEAYMKLYHEEWRSSQIFVPKDPSIVAFRGFKGDYTVKIKQNQQELSEIRFKLEDDITFDCVSDLLGSLLCYSVL